MICKLFEFPPNVMRGLIRQETNFDVIYDLSRTDLLHQHGIDVLNILTGNLCGSYVECG